MLKKLLVYLMCISILILNANCVELRKDIETIAQSTVMTLNSVSACLMEASSGEILYEQNSRDHYEPASVTKIMSMLLVMEEIEKGNLKLDDMVTGSMHAAEMGGSQIWLEYGEELSVNDMLKAVFVVSANDCTVALAEHVAGSEENFVAKMNERAKQLGMNDTNFMNATGLPQENHYTCAYDIALMSRELLKHDLIFNYTTIWMDSLRNGQSGLTNTNKLIRFYKGANGLKTGYTSSAKYCLSASAKREGMQLISTVMKAETSDKRFEDAKKLLDYGFANFSVYSEEPQKIENIKVVGGAKPSVPVKYDKIDILMAKGREKNIEKIMELESHLTAPVKNGQKVGCLRYVSMGEEVAAIDIFTSSGVERINYMGIFKKVFKKLIMIR